ITDEVLRKRIGTVSVPAAPLLEPVEIESWSVVHGTAGNGVAVPAAVVGTSVPGSDVVVSGAAVVVEALVLPAGPTATLVDVPLPATATPTPTAMATAARP